VRWPCMDIWDRLDDFHFAYANLHGDGSVTARIESVENVQEWTKAGVMIRTTLDPDSPNAMLLATPGGIVSFQYRRRASEITSQVYTPSSRIQLPHWVGNRHSLETAVLCRYHRCHQSREERADRGSGQYLDESPDWRCLSAARRTVLQDQST